MSETIIKAMERTEDLRIVRKAGFVPGVLNGPGTKSTSVKFESTALNKVIAKHGKNAKLWVELGPNKLFGFIKDIQRHPVEGNIIHTVIHLVTADQEVKMQLPIVYHGVTQLEHKMLHIQIYKSEIEVLGRADKMPDSIIVDVSEKELGANILAADLNLPAEIKNLDEANEVYAVVKVTHEIPAEEPEEPKEDKEAKPAE